MNKKIVTSIGVVLLALIAGGFYLWSQKNVDLTQINAEKESNNNKISIINIEKIDSSD